MQRVKQEQGDGHQQRAELNYCSTCDTLQHQIIILHSLLGLGVQFLGQQKTGDKKGNQHVKVLLQQTLKVPTFICCQLQVKLNSSSLQFQVGY